MEHKGKISGIGNKTTRKNEITADDLAIMRSYCFGNNIGIIDKTGYNFDILNQSNSTIKLCKGVCYAYGYIGYIDIAEINFIRPSLPQYHIIYVELNKSVIPNVCTLKTKNNGSNGNIEINTLRQDYLSVIRTGICQIPLYVVKLTSEGIETIKDERPLKKHIRQTEIAESTCEVVGEIDKYAVYVENPSLDDKSNKVVNIGWVNALVKQVITEGDEI